MHNVPSGAPSVIDISPIYKNDKQSRDKVIQQIRESCLDNGFFQIINHNVPSELQKKVFNCSADFFSLPVEKKLKVDKSQNWYNRGYELLQSQILEEGTLPELKEGIYFGRELPLDHPSVIAKKVNCGPNLWPQDVSNPDEFKKTISLYFDTMTKLAKELIELIAEGLGIDSKYFNEFTNEASCTVRLLHYPPQPVNEAANQRGIGKHTDFGFLAILMQDNVGGLQVLNRKTGDWVDVDPIEGAYVVNLGDMMQRWTNDKYVSNFHRVINKSGKERYSVPFFFNGNPDFVVTCLPGCEQDGVSKYPPVDIDSYTKNRYNVSYGRANTYKTYEVDEVK